MDSTYINDIANSLLNEIPLSELGFAVFGISLFLIALVFIIIFRNSITKANFFTKLGLFSLVTFFLGLALCAFEPIIGIFIVAFSLIIFLMSVLISFIRLVVKKISDVFIITALISLFLALVFQLFGFILGRNIAICIITLCVAIKTCILIFKKETPEDKKAVNNISQNNNTGNTSNLKDQHTDNQPYNNTPHDNQAYGQSDNNIPSSNNPESDKTDK